MRKLQILKVFSLSLVLSACGGSDSNESVDAPVAGLLTVSISDAPMYQVQKVELVLEHLMMTDANGHLHQFPLNGIKFNLMDYRGMESFKAIDSLSIPEGRYHNVSISVLDGEGNQGCAVENGSGRHGLMIEGGMLPLEDFTIMPGQHLSQTLEIDLYRSLWQQLDEYHLQHDGMYAVDNRYMGHLVGEIDPLWIASCEAQHAAQMVNSGQFSHMAYLYNADVTGIEMMADASSGRTDQRQLPVALSPIHQNSLGGWSFSMGFLPEGEYRVGYSCLGHLDDPAIDDINQGTFSLFSDGGVLNIDAGEYGGQQNDHHCGGGHGGHGG